MWLFLSNIRQVYLSFTLFSVKCKVEFNWWLYWWFACHSCLPISSWLGWPSDFTRVTRHLLDNDDFQSLLMMKDKCFSLFIRQFEVWQKSKESSHQEKEMYGSFNPMNDWWWAFQTDSRLFLFGKCLCIYIGESISLSSSFLLSCLHPFFSFSLSFSQDSHHSSIYSKVFLWLEKS